jgi:hypothetical protein
MLGLMMFYTGEVYHSYTIALAIVNRIASVKLTLSHPQSRHCLVLRGKDEHYSKGIHERR